METYRIGPLTIAEMGKDPIQLEGETTSGAQAVGFAKIYEVHSDDGSYLQLARIRWSTGKEDIRTYGEVHGGVALRRLEGGRLRMSIYELDESECWVELAQARVDPTDPVMWATAKSASLEELNAGAQLNCEEILLDAGALRVGTKRELCGDESKRSSFLIAIFEKENERVPIAAYALTKILPLIHEYAGPQPRLL